MSFTSLGFTEGLWQRDGRFTGGEQPPAGRPVGLQLRAAAEQRARGGAGGGAGGAVLLQPGAEGEKHAVTAHSVL